jgi:hypothetical protein
MSNIEFFFGLTQKYDRAFFLFVCRRFGFSQKYQGSKLETSIILHAVSFAGQSE